jgi:hypothetical protein
VTLRAGDRVAGTAIAVSPVHPDGRVLRVWPRNDSVDRGDLNQLVFRLRADLTSAGVDGGALVDRFAKGGATRFVVGPSVAIKVVT